MYKFMVKNNTTLNSILIDFIHNYGLKEVERIHREMTDIKEQHKFGGSLKDFSKYLKIIDIV